MKKTILGLCALALVGCSSVSPNYMKVGSYKVKQFTIHVLEKEDLRIVFNEMYHTKSNRVLGFYNKATREIFTLKHPDQNYSFEVLGHEVWHLEELGGNSFK